MTQTTPHLTSPTRGVRPRVQDLAEAVLAGGDQDEVLELLVRSARSDLSAATCALIMPLGEQQWTHEIVTGSDASTLLGRDVDPSSPLGRALRGRDKDAAEAIGTLDVGDGTRDERRALVGIVDGGDQGLGVLVALRITGIEQSMPFSDAERERMDSLAGLVALTLRGPLVDSGSEIDDERSRIARDLHDLAIQELFAVGMELDALTESLSSTGEPPSNARVRTAVSDSVQGVENAVTQIRQIVQSLRRERAEATLSERLRHEVGLATSGLGFIPTLRLPQPPIDIDGELPPEIAEDVVAVVRECLANAARHAHATAVAVSVNLYSEGIDRVVQVNVSDNGRGIDPAVSRRSGLANMSSRARRHAGWVDAFALEPGTMIAWRVTLPPES